MADPKNGQKSEQGRKSEPTYLIFSILFILVGITILILLYVPFHIDTIPLLASGISTTLIVGGVALLTFEKISNDHHQKLLDELALRHEENLASIKNTANNQMKKIKDASMKHTLRGLISGGDKIWERLEKEFIRQPFYMEKKEIIYVFKKDKTSKRVEIITYQRAIIRNTAPVTQQYPLHIFSKYNDIETNTDTEFGYDYIRIDGKDYTEKIQPIEDKYNAGHEIREDVPIPGESTLIIESKSRKSSILHDFYNEIILTGTEDVIIQIFREPSIKIYFWGADKNKSNDGIINSSYIKKILKDNPDYKELVQENQLLEGVLKGESFTIEWYA